MPQRKFFVAIDIFVFDFDLFIGVPFLVSQIKEEGLTVAQTASPLHFYVTTVFR